MTQPWEDSEPIIVATNEYGLPTKLVWRGETHRITKIFKEWEVEKDFSHPAGSIHYLCMEILTNRNLNCIICQRQPEGEWQLARNFD